MKIVRLAGGALALSAFVAVALVYAQVPARSFDLQGSPTTVKRPAADITDAFLFPSPSNANNVVAVMDVYPQIPSSTSASTALNTFFDQSVLYTFKFDNNYTSEAANGGRPTEDLVLQVSFGAPSGGTQQVYVYGPLAPNGTGTSIHLVNAGVPSATGFVNKSFSLGNGIQVFAGARRDPAFLNATATQSSTTAYPFFTNTPTPGTYFGIFPNENPNTMTGQSCLTTGACPNGFIAGTDLFGQTDVLSIVAEIPKIDLTGASGIVAFWATTSTQSGQ